MSDWISVEDRLPPKKDKYYLFGGFDANGNWVYDKYHYDLSGSVNGWTINVLIRNGNTHWCDPEPPKEKDSE